MKWYLIFYVFVGSSGGIDSSMMPSYRPPTAQAKVEMPSKEICEEVVRLNKFQNMECWGKSE